MDNETDYHKLNTSKKEFLNEKDIENIQGTLSYDNKIKLDKMIKPLKDEIEIYEKRKNIIESFKYFDKDNNGLIKVTEFKNIISLLKINITEKLENFLERASFEGNGFINYVEFANFLFKPVENKTKKIFKKKEEEECFKIISDNKKSKEYIENKDVKKEINIIQDYTEHKVEKIDLIHAQIDNEVTYKKQKIKLMNLQKLMNENLTNEEYLNIISSLGTDLKNNIIYEISKEPEKFIPLEEAVKSEENTTNFCLGVLAKLLNNNGIFTAIEKQPSNDNLSSAMNQLILSGEIFRKVISISYNYDEKKVQKFVLIKIKKKNGSNQKKIYIQNY